MTMPRGLLAALVIGCALGCNAAPLPAEAEPSGRASPTGWEVRYNAALALARRGSDRVTDPAVRESLLELLDEGQQRRNFRVKLAEGRTIPDEVGARTAVIGGLKAVTELRRRRPELDFADFRQAAEQLTTSSNPLIRNEAKLTLEVLAP